MEPNKSIPTLYEWAGGVKKFEELTDVFYDKVLKDPVLEPVFRHMPPRHSTHVAHFIAEVRMGPKFYSNEYGDDALRHMVGKHIGRKLTEQQRKKWVTLLMESADEIGLPDDPEFRSTFIAHIEWGTRVALLNSQLDETQPPPTSKFPTGAGAKLKGLMKSLVLYSKRRNNPFSNSSTLVSDP